MTFTKFISIFTKRTFTMYPCHSYNQIVGLKQLVNSYNKGSGGKLICFPVPSDSIEVIKNPKSFYSKLKVISFSIFCFLSNLSNLLYFCFFGILFSLEIY